VILHALHLHNVGVYKGRQTLHLTPPDRDHPVILIGALNGGGKTTLLGALQLALYGSRVQGIDRSRRGYQRHLEELIHRGADPSEGASVELEFERHIDGRPIRFHIRRSWRMESGEVKEQFQVHRNGDPDLLLASHWDESMDTFLPPRLAHLFFFDGEQIERMAEEDAASALLGSAFQSLLGLDLVARLDEDLATLERRKRSTLRPPEAKAQLDLLENEAVKAEKRVAAIHLRRAQLTNQREAKEKSLHALREKFRNEGGELFLQREQWEADHLLKTTELNQVEERLREVVAGCAPLLLVPDLLQELRSQVVHEQKARRERIVAEAEDQRDKEVLKELKKKLPAELLKAVATTLEKHRPERSSIPAEEMLHASDDFLTQWDDLVKRELPQSEKELKHLGSEADRLKEELATLDRRLSAVPDADALARTQREMATLEAELADLAEKFSKEEELLRQADFDLRIRHAAVQKELDKHVDDWEEADHDRRILERIPKVKQTLEIFRQRVVARHVSALEHAIAESFHHLVRKPRLMGKVQIDPASFRIQLQDADGQELPFGLLSAGERQLLATSILWALAKISGRPVPLVIDTPLGRLDSHHRTHVVQRYFPNASHQVILLSTDEEIVGRYATMIQPYVGCSALLNFDEALQQTTIQPGYFETHEAASRSN
jgi:DNA sulfur modification protein DndD